MSDLFAGLSIPNLPDKLEGDDLKDFLQQVLRLLDDMILKTRSSTEFTDVYNTQTVAGVKSFSSFPITPSTDPTTDYQVVNKKYVDGINTSIQGLITTLDGAVVKTSGDQSIAGIKTFSSFPVTPSADPTTDYQVANKKYVDSKSDHGELTGLEDNDHPQYARGQASAEIINRGSGSIGSGGDATVTFKTSFSSSSSYNIVACLVGSGSYDACLTVKSKSAGSAVLHNGNGVGLTYEYIAIGT